MALPPIVNATIQSSVLSATANLIAQAITAYRKNTPLVFDWVPVFQFFIFTVISTPPNFLWQEFLESTFPAYHIAPTSEAVSAAAENDEKTLDKEAKEGHLVEPKLNISNTIIKLLLDQTVGAAVNTVIFCFFINSIQLAMARPLGAPYSARNQSIQYLVNGLLGKKGVTWANKGLRNVDYALVAAKSKADFWPIITAGLGLWPLVSLVNFTLIKTVEGRNLLGSLAGVIWGVYMSLVAAQ